MSRISWTLKEGANSGGLPDFPPRRALRKQHRLDKAAAASKLTAPKTAKEKPPR